MSISASTLCVHGNLGCKFFKQTILVSTKMNNDSIKSFFFSKELIFYLLISIFFLYFFWFQFAITPIPFFPECLGLLLFGYVFVKATESGLYFNNLKYYYLFLLYVTATSLIVSPEYSISYLIKVYRYTVPMLAIIYFVNHDYNKFIRIQTVLLLTIAFLVFFYLFSNTHTLYDYTKSAERFLGEENPLNTNTFSSYILMANFSAFALTLKSKKNIYMLLVVVFTCLSVYTQLLLASRRGIISFMLFVLPSFYLIVLYKYKSKALLFGFVLLVLFSLFIASQVLDWQNYNIFERFYMTGYEGDDLRYYFYVEAWRMFQDKFFLGYGLGGFTQRIGVYSHSLYAELISCLGIVGTIIFVVFILFDNLVFLFKTIKNKLYTSGVNNPFNILLILYLLNIICCGFFIVYFSDMFFYIILSIFYSYRNIISYSESNDSFESDALISPLPELSSDTSH